MSVLQFENVKCKDCCKCIGACPVKSIEVKNQQAMIVERDCILCGNCTVVCPQDTKHNVNDVAKIKELIHQGKQVIASVAPSFVAYFDTPGIDSFRKALLKLGFSDACETAEGAYLVKTEYEKLVDTGTGKTIISSCCPTVNSYIKKYYPEAIPYLAAVTTPMKAHAKLLKERFPEAIVVFVGPCISKKAECSDSDSDVACAITFGDLGEWLQERNIELTKEDKTNEKYLSRMFPVAGGILKTMQKKDNYTYLTAAGSEDCMSALHDIVAGKLENCFVEMSFCEGSCVGGPSFRKRKIPVLTAGLKVSDIAEEKNTEDHYNADYNVQTDASLRTMFKDEQTMYPKPTEKQIAAIFKKMGKESVEDEMNCGMCGYPTCRDKAIAVFMGRAEITMCMPFMKKRAESFSDKIINVTPSAIMAVDMDLKVQQINKAACDIFGLESEDIVGQPVSRILDEFDFVDMISNKKEKLEKYTFMAEYNVYLEQAFFYDINSGIIVCIMKNITKERQKRNQLMRVKTQAASMADDIVEKQLRIVHEIASLLGESAAETKIAIAELKDSIMMESDDR
ncbi:MAG: [Fe-Fe] hydrogenase large subunit C-terminal domain-containing protein [Oscillospiraceae bacterium]|jgi:PAS domain S-box-containing protein